ncbi:MAG: hypothetical protein LBH00_05690 [Planctomycetaceae bacterium]|jgi:hypothetical protein|nr:hypothetical protein [Planctomycetaceae bacterium]
MRRLTAILSAAVSVIFCGILCTDSSAQMLPVAASVFDSGDTPAAADAESGMTYTGVPFGSRRFSRAAVASEGSPLLMRRSYRMSRLAAESESADVPPMPVPSRRFGQRILTSPESGEEEWAAPQRQPMFNSFRQNRQQPSPDPLDVHANTGTDPNAVNATVYRPAPFKNFRALMTAPRPYLGYSPNVLPAMTTEPPPALDPALPQPSDRK